MKRPLVLLMAVACAGALALGGGGVSTGDPPIPDTVSGRNPTPPRLNPTPPFPPPPSPAPTPGRPPGPNRVDVDVDVVPLTVGEGERLIVTAGPGAVFPGVTLLDIRSTKRQEIAVIVAVYAHSGLDSLIVERFPPGWSR